MPILISDTSVLIDMERASLLEAAFRCQFEFVVPDLLYERELKSNMGPRLQQLGLRVEELTPDETTSAQTLRQANLAISLPDAFALTLAQARGLQLLAGDGALRSLALASQVDCHGTLWLMDQMLAQAVSSPAELHGGLSKLAVHPRCRLPQREIQVRLARWV